MKALFYTATAVFITLAGVIAFFALQPPTSLGGPRIVVDIDASTMPAVDAVNNARAPLDPYPGAEDDKPAGSADSAALPPTEQQPGDAAPPQRQQQDHVQRPQEEPEGSAAAQHGEAMTSPPPGMALAGLNQDRPLFREITPDPQAAADNASQGEERIASAPSDDAALPGANVALPAAPLPERDASREPAGQSPKETAAAPARAFQPNIAEFVPTPVAPPAPPPPIPVRRPNDLPTADATSAGNSWAGVQYANTEVSPKTADAGGKTARVALLLRGVGRNDQDAADAIGSLPSAVSLGFWPYASDGRQLAVRAREKGHEVIVQLPLEPADYPASNAGPDTLLTSSRPEQNVQRLQTVLKRFDAATGVTNLMGGKMLHAKAPLKPVLEDLKAHGLLYVGESNNSHGTVRELAREINLRFGAADVLIDAQPTPEAIDKALARLIAVAKQRGSAIGIGSANAITVQQVHEWSDTLAEQGITLVPVGALAQTPGSS